MPAPEVITTMNPTQQADLIRAACEARTSAYAPYSKFLVGAALLAGDGRVYRGCNVENASYGLTNCAERVAIGTAVADGARDFKAIAIATAGGFTPCGACRQVLAEFAPKLVVLLVDADHSERVFETTLDVLLPGQFTLKSS